MKTVMLDYASKEFSVTEEGYACIRALIQEHQLCDRCRQPIDQDEHRLVGKNLGLRCLLRRQPSLTFLGPIATNEDGDTTYAFTDAEDAVYTILANSGDEARKDTYSSIQRAGFTPPAEYVPFKGDKDHPVKLGRYNWTIYGKLTSSVIVLVYKDSYPTMQAVFLAYKDGQAVELNKRNLAYKQLFERAKAIMERTKRNGTYRLNGYEQYRYTDEDLYPIVAQLEAAVWDVQRTFLPVPNTYEQQELVPPEAPAEEPAPEAAKRGRRPRLSLVPNDTQPQEAVAETSTAETPVTE